MLLNYLKKVVEQILPELLAKALVNLIQLDKDSQYLIAVENDQIAQDLITALEKHFDLSQGPRFIIIPAKDFKVLEISKKIGNQS